ncbi:MAG TPA: endonuclease V [Geobacteraceae bacterium]|nr:endonuclease V [Geobacteraceae bacterium]
MIACVDVAYHGSEASTACVLFRHWSDEKGEQEIVVQTGSVEEYQPGQFYRRELPCLLAVLALVQAPLEAVIVDGYVWLGDNNEQGLGAILHEALGTTTAVIGVAKSRFAGATGAVPVLRGTSNRPLYVTAAGMDTLVAARHIQSMHGAHRIPTLLKRADQLSRAEGLTRGRDQ